MEDGEQDVFIVVTQVGTYTFGIMVDRVFDTEEIVVKPMAPVLRDNPVFSGNTILGDGSVVMILDPNGIASKRGQAKGADRSDAGMAGMHHDRKSVGWGQGVSVSVDLGGRMNINKKKHEKYRKNNECNID